MTKTEAINIMLQMIKDEEEFLSDNTVEAHKMAIQALSQEPCEDWYDVPSDEMTLEQARQAVKDLRKKLAKYLEQEPTTKNDLGVDCVSRILVQSAISKSIEYKENPYQLYKRIERLPSVTPQEPKTGHWIKSRDWYGNYHFTCPFCEHDIATKYTDTWEDNYCSNCGAKMVEPQESEEI